MGKVKYLYNRVDEAIIPAGKGNQIYRDKDWIKTTIVITEDMLLYKNPEDKGKIPLVKLYYVDRKMNYPKADSGNVINFNYRKEDGNYFGMVKSRYKEKLKKTILTTTISDINIYFMSPYQSGGRIHTDEEWKEGVFELTTKTIKLWKDDDIANEIKQKNITKVTTDEIKGYNAVKIFYEREGVTKADLVFSPEVSLDVIKDFFVELLAGKGGSKAPLNEMEKEILMVVETGMNSSSDIAEIVDMSNEEVIEALDTLVDKGYLKVTGHEKIVDLTPAGRKEL